MLKAYWVKTKYGYQGYVDCVDNLEKVLWTEKAGIDRVCIKDAMEDAEWLKKQLLEINYE